MRIYRLPVLLEARVRVRVRVRVGVTVCQFSWRFVSSMVKVSVVHVGVA